MEISVVMAVYNGEDYLEEAINSILMQTYQDFEFIIVNNGSTDGTAQIINKINDPRVKVVQMDNNQGISAARNLGIDQAKGDWIVLQDDDDISLPQRIEAQVKYLQEHPEVIQVCTMIEVIAGKTAVPLEQLEAEANYVNATLTWEQIRQKRFFSSPICFGTSMYAKKVFQQAGGYNAEYQLGEDYDLFLRMLELGCIAVVPQKLYKYRVDPYSNSRRDPLKTYNTLKIISTKYICKQLVDQKIRPPRLIIIGTEEGCTNYKTKVAPYVNMEVIEYISQIDPGNLENNLAACDSKKIDGIILLSHAFASSVEQAINNYFIKQGLRKNQQLFLVDGWMFAAPGWQQPFLLKQISELPAIEEVQGIITELIKEHCLECGVEANELLTRAMEYNPFNRQISYNLSLIMEYAEYFQVPWESTIQIMACHELGHNLDFSKAPAKLQKLNVLKLVADSRNTDSRDAVINFIEEVIANEYSAWECGKTLVPDRLRRWYDELNERNIKNYQDKFAEYSRCKISGKINNPLEIFKEGG